MAPPGWSPRPGSLEEAPAQPQPACAHPPRNFTPLTAHTHTGSLWLAHPLFPGGRAQEALSRGRAGEPEPAPGTSGGGAPAGAETSCPCLAPAAPLVRSHGWPTPAVARGPVTFTPASPPRPPALGSPPPCRGPAHPGRAGPAPPRLLLEIQPAGAGGRGRAGGRGGAGGGDRRGAGRGGPGASFFTLGRRSSPAAAGEGMGRGRTASGRPGLA